MRDVAWMLVAVLAVVLCSTTYGEATIDMNDVGGVTLRMLGGDQMQELRVGYLEPFEIKTVEPAVGFLHRDAPDGAAEEWPIRGYIMAHALTADMIAQFTKLSVDLPKGDIYAGLFLEYTYDRDKEWAGGWLVGGMAAWPSPVWQSVVEYQRMEWNATDKTQVVMAGLCRGWKAVRQQGK